MHVPFLVLTGVNALKVQDDTFINII